MENRMGRNLAMRQCITDVAPGGQLQTFVIDHLGPHSRNRPQHDELRYLAVS